MKYGKFYLKFKVVNFDFSCPSSSEINNNLICTLKLFSNVPVNMTSSFDELGAENFTIRNQTTEFTKTFSTFGLKTIFASEASENKLRRSCQSHGNN